MSNKIYLSLLSTILLFSACDHSNDLTDSLFTNMPSNKTGIRFINKVTDQQEMNILRYKNFYNGGGVTLGDINNDGLIDIYLTANQGKNKLYLNRGNLVFEDISKQSGTQGYSSAWSSSATMVDINNDGYLDIFVCNGLTKSRNISIRRNQLYINNKDNTFKESSKDYGLSNRGLSTQAAFFDYDLDGDLDLFIVNHSLLPNTPSYNAKARNIKDQSWNVANILKGGGDKFYRNDNNKFIDVSSQSGIYSSLLGYGNAAAIADINRDGYPDIYVTNDLYERDYLYINQGNGNFKESLYKYIDRSNKNATGVNIIDINNDALNDIFVTGSLPWDDERIKTYSRFASLDEMKQQYRTDYHRQYLQNSLQIADGIGHWHNIAHAAGVGSTDYSRGAAIFDMDNDGYKDIYIVNGRYRNLYEKDFMQFYTYANIQKMALAGSEEDIKAVLSKTSSQPLTNKAFKNDGQLKFTDQTTLWGLDIPSYSSGVAYADLDNDGDNDMVINNVNQKAILYRNNSESLSDYNFLKLKLIGLKNNKFGIGAHVQLFCGKEIITHEHYPSGGGQSSTSYIPVIGLGQHTVDSLTVTWSDKKQQTLKGIKLNQTLSLRQSDATISQESITSISPLLSVIKNPFPKQVLDSLDSTNNDLFKYRTLSNQDAAIAIGDINNDDLEDIFIGGSKGRAAHIYLQKADGKWRSSSDELFIQDKNFEDTAATFVDIDNDNDDDLIVGSGGDITTKAEDYKIRLYLNDGKGQYLRGNNLPENKYNTAVIIPFDVDDDGDIDLFVGARSVPQIYGVNPRHKLLENDGNGHYSDITTIKAPDLNNIGMLTDAIRADIDGDYKKELIITTDWGGVYILKNTLGKLSLLPSNINQWTGWWQCVSIIDVNADGKNDIVLGNRGTNNPYKPSKENPISLLIKDFDKNGEIERLMYQIVNNKNKPIAFKEDLQQQIPFLSLDSISYKHYAQKSLNDIFPNISIEASSKSVTEARSLVAINLGDGNFRKQILPEPVQWSSVHDILVRDINHDGDQDLIIGGNDYNYQPQYGRLDASQGLLLLGETKSGHFRVSPAADSGLYIDGQIRYILPLNTADDSSLILFSRHNEQIVILKEER